MAKAGETILIDCPKCEARVSAKILAVREYSPDGEIDAPTQMYFSECVSCKRILLAYSEMMFVDAHDFEWDKPTRLWPPRDRSLWDLPDSVRTSIDEARKCFSAKAYSACAVMCGKALESICKESGIKNWKLQKGLKDLKEKGIIDGRLFEWGEALRESRNTGAHASEGKITREDAKDILDFTIAIGDYVYVLTKKYESFKARQGKDQDFAF